MSQYRAVAVPTGLRGVGEPRWEIEVSGEGFKGVTQALFAPEILPMAKDHLASELDVPVGSVGLLLSFDFARSEAT